MTSLPIAVPTTAPSPTRAATPSTATQSSTGRATTGGTTGIPAAGGFAELMLAALAGLAMDAGAGLAAHGGGGQAAPVEGDVPASTAAGDPVEEEPTPEGVPGAAEAGTMPAVAVQGTVVVASGSVAVPVTDPATAPAATAATDPATESTGTATARPTTGATTGPASALVPVPVAAAGPVPGGQPASDQTGTIPTADAPVDDATAGTTTPAASPAGTVRTGGTLAEATALAEALSGPSSNSGASNGAGSNSAATSNAAANSAGASAVGTPAGATTPAAPGQPAQTAPTPGPIGAQVLPELTRLHSAGNGTHRMTLQLHPETLGEVRVTLVVRDGAVQVSLAASDAARQALSDDAPMLQRLLELSGATDSRVVVRDLPAAAAHGGTTNGSFGQAAGQGDTQGQPPGQAPGQGRAGNGGPFDDRQAGTHAGSTARDGDTAGAPLLRPHEPEGQVRVAGVDLTI